MAENPMTYDLAPLRRILDEYGGQKGAVIPILQRVQEAYGYLPKELLVEISKRTGIPLTRLIGVATFYAQFRLARRGKHLIRVCDGTACHVRGASKNVEAVEDTFALGRRRHIPGLQIHHGNRLLHRLVRPGAGGCGR